MMNNKTNMLSKLNRYFLDTLDLHIKAERWDQAEQLPLFLRDMYEVHLISVLNGSFLLMIAKEQKEQTPAIVRKHLVKIQDMSGYDAIYMKDAVSAYNRKRLIEQKVPFIIPGNQMYLPMLGIDFREHFRKQREETTRFNPSTQVFMLYAMYHSDLEIFTPNYMAKKLGYSAMTMTRAFDELQQLGIGEHAVKGRERSIHFRERGKVLWDNILHFMKSPVKKEHHALVLHGQEPGVHGGLDALARYTMLSEPKNKVYALSGNKWRNLRQEQKLREVTIPEPDSIKIEVWSYEPGLFVQNNTADRLSLFLSLRDTKDERVEAALNEMMEGMQW